MKKYLFIVLLVGVGLAQKTAVTAKVKIQMKIYLIITPKRERFRLGVLMNLF